MGYARHGVNVGLESWIVAEFLREHDLSTAMINIQDRGYRTTDLVMTSSENYSDAPFLLKASVEYAHLPYGSPNPHAVIITDISKDSVTYHDPGLHHGANTTCSREDFERALRMYTRRSVKSSYGSNLMVIWDHDHVPDLHKALGDLAQKNQKSDFLK